MSRTSAKLGLARGAAGALAAVWIFNIWGAVDLLYAAYRGPRVQLDPGGLGAGFYIVTAIVPPLLVSHDLVFGLLLRG